MRAAAVANKGPIIHGSGVLTQTQSYAATKPSTRVRTTERKTARN
jgi:hypothetical protein